ncbi:MAG: type II secretion system GspH family protein [Planctomycetota bacterium]|nr:type II secretion system GspH family protein [Planctomycetota bacterium]
MRHVVTRILLQGSPACAEGSAPPCIAGFLKGMTLLEVVIATTIFAAMIVAALGLMGQVVDTADTDMSQAFAEEQVQNAADTIVLDLKETSPQLCWFYQFTEDGRNQTAIVFPCARNQAGRFIYKVGTNVSPTPVWQSIRVYCYAGDPAAGRDDGYIYRYDDYNTRSYTNPITVTSITSAEIRLSDGTRFNRTGSLSANQTRTIVQGRFTSLSATRDATTGKIRMNVQSRYRQRGGPLGTDFITVTLSNEVLSRNRN